MRMLNLSNFSRTKLLLYELFHTKHFEISKHSLLSTKTTASICVSFEHSYIIIRSAHQMLRKYFLSDFCLGGY